MSPTIKTIKKIAVPVLRKAGVRKGAVFGSVARGESGAKSDIDMLIQQRRGRFSLLDLVRLEQELSERLGRKVDLGTYDSVHPYLKDRIFNEAVTIYESRRKRT